MEHIVFCNNKDNELDNIVSNNQTAIIRAGVSRKIPHSRVFKGEKLYFSTKGSNIIEYAAEVKEVYNYNKVFNGEIKKTVDSFKDKLRFPEEKLENFYKKCVCVIEFENLEKIDSIHIRPQAPLIDWIILEDVNDVKVK